MENALSLIKSSPLPPLPLKRPLTTSDPKDGRSPDLHLQRLETHTETPDWHHEILMPDVAFDGKKREKKKRKLLLVIIGLPWGIASSRATSVTVFRHLLFPFPQDFTSRHTGNTRRFFPPPPKKVTQRKRKERWGFWGSLSLSPFGF